MLSKSFSSFSSNTLKRITVLIFVTVGIINRNSPSVVTAETGQASFRYVAFAKRCQLVKEIF